MALETVPWNLGDALNSPEARAAYIEAALEENDVGSLLSAIGDVARLVGMADVAREAGLGRESLYKALSADGNPSFATLMKVLRALGVSLHAGPLGHHANDDYALRLPATETAKPEIG